jgi:hypothetical protein
MTHVSRAINICHPPQKTAGQDAVLSENFVEVLFVEVLVPHEPAIGDQFCGIQVLLNSEKFNRSPELWAAKTTRSQIV